MGILGKIAWPFRKMGKGFKWLFSRYSKEIMTTIEEFAAAIVLDLMSSGKPGGAKFEEALIRLKLRVAKEGFEVYNHVLQRAIEKRVTQAHSDDLEEIIDSGLSLAKGAVREVDLTNLMGDKERREEAARRLAVVAKQQGKKWFDTEHILRVLIQYAVSSVRAGEE